MGNDDSQFDKQDQLLAAMPQTLTDTDKEILTDMRLAIDSLIDELGQQRDTTPCEHTPTFKLDFHYPATQAVHYHLNTLQRGIKAIAASIPTLDRAAADVEHLTGHAPDRTWASFTAPGYAHWSDNIDLDDAPWTERLGSPDDRGKGR